MSKKTNIAVAIVISSFLAMNLYLLFSDKSVIPKSVYVDRYERMAANACQQELGKEGLIAPPKLYRLCWSMRRPSMHGLFKRGIMLTSAITRFLANGAGGRATCNLGNGFDALQQQYPAANGYSVGSRGGTQQARYRLARRMSQRIRKGN